MMEYVEGNSLQAVVDRDGACSLEYVAPIIVRICDALQYAHDRGVMHLDIKPANILVGPWGDAKLCDFGIARMAIGNATTATQRIITGSVGYMPPEQYRGRKFVSFTSDVYSLGATVYAAVTGDVPIGIRVDDDAVPPSVLRAMQRNPEKRYQSVEEFKTSICQRNRREYRSVSGRPSSPFHTVGPCVLGRADSHRAAESAARCYQRGNNDHGYGPFLRAYGAPRASRFGKGAVGGLAEARPHISHPVAGRRRQAGGKSGSFKDFR